MTILVLALALGIRMLALGVVEDGLLSLNPLGGALVGAAAGAVGGKLTDIGIDDDLIKRIAAQLEPGRAAVFALVRRSTPDRVADALKQYRPVVLHTNLSHDREEDLVQALQAP